MTDPMNPERPVLCIQPMTAKDAARVRDVERAREWCEEQERRWEDGDNVEEFVDITLNARDCATVQFMRNKVIKVRVYNFCRFKFKNVDEAIRELEKQVYYAVSPAWDVVVLSG